METFQQIVPLLAIIIRAEKGGEDTQKTEINILLYALTANIPLLGLSLTKWESP